MELANSRNSSIRKCAFCKNWYDPTNAGIKPDHPQVGLWRYEPRRKCQCMVRNTEMYGYESCGKFECKL